MAYAAPTFGVLALALMGLVAAELATGAGAGGGMEPAAPDAAPQPLLPAPSLPEQHLKHWEQNATRELAALARPLFTPDRRPPSPDAAAPAVALNAPPRLAGTLVSPGRRQAVFETASKPAVVGEGDRIDAWTVEAISPGKVTLAGPGGPRMLYVSFARDDRMQEAKAAQLLAPLRPLRTHSRVGAAVRS